MTIKKISENWKGIWGALKIFKELHLPEKIGIDEWDALTDIKNAAEKVDNLVERVNQIAKDDNPELYGQLTKLMEQGEYLPSETIIQNLEMINAIYCGREVVVTTKTSFLGSSISGYTTCPALILKEIKVSEQKDGGYHQYRLDLVPNQKGDFYCGFRWLHGYSFEPSWLSVKFHFQPPKEEIINLRDNKCCKPTEEQLKKYNFLIDNYEQLKGFLRSEVEIIVKKYYNAFNTEFSKCLSGIINAK